MKFGSIAAFLAVFAHSADALSTLSTRVGVSTTTVTATSFETSTSTIISVSEITSVATTCAVGSTGPAGQLLSSCTESVWYSGGIYWQQHCSAALVGGTTIRAYVFPNAQGASVALSFCTALNNLHIPASSCKGVNIVSIGALQQAYLLNGDVTITSTSSASREIQLFTTNPCEITATTIATDFSAAVETSAVVYTSTYEVSYLETITVSIPDATTSSTLTSSSSISSSSAVPLNATTSLVVSTSTSLSTNSFSTLSVLPIANTTTIAPILTRPLTSLNATTLTVVPIAVNATSTSASNVISTASSISNATVATPSSSNHTSTLLRPFSSITIPIFNTSISAIRPVYQSSSPIFLNTSSATSTQLSSITSDAPIVVAIPVSSTSPNTQALPASMSERPITLTRYITDVSTVTACPSSVRNCPASQKTTFLITQTIVEYSSVSAATPTLNAQASSAQPLVSGSSAQNGGNKTEYTTSTLYSTSIQTVTGCPPSAKNCPASEKTVYYTDVVDAYTTVCPVSATAGSISSVATHNVQSSGEVAVDTAYTTSILYSTSVRTVVACPTNVKNCPASRKTVYLTDVVEAYTTVCPVTAAQAIPSATSTMSNGVPSSGLSIFGAASSTEHFEGAAPTPSSLETVLASSSSNPALISKITVDADTARILTATGTWTYTAPGDIVTSTRRFPPVSVISSSPTSRTETATTAPYGISSSSIAKTLSLASSSSVADVVSAGSSSGPNTTAGMRSLNNTSTLDAASTSVSMKNKTSTAGITGSPTLALYTGSASALGTHKMSVFLGAAGLLFGVALAVW